METAYIGRLTRKPAYTSRFAETAASFFFALVFSHGQVFLATTSTDMHIMASQDVIDQMLKEGAENGWNRLILSFSVTIFKWAFFGFWQ